MFWCRPIEIMSQQPESPTPTPSTASSSSTAATVGTRSSALTVTRSTRRSTAHSSGQPNITRIQSPSPEQQRRQSSKSSDSTSSSPRGPRPPRDSEQNHAAYWSQYLPSKEDTVQRLQSTSPTPRDVSLEHLDMERDSQKPQNLPLPPRPLSGPPGFLAGERHTLHESSAATARFSQYSLVWSSEPSAVPRTATPKAQRRPRAARAVRSGPPSISAFPVSAKLQHSRHDPSSPPQSPHGTPHLHSSAEVSPNWRGTFHHSFTDLASPQSSPPGLARSPNIAVMPRTQSHHSSNSSKSDSSSPHNFSYPRNYSASSDNKGIAETAHAAVNSQLVLGRANELGVDGQIDRSRYRMNRSKSNSTDYSPEAFRRLHGGVMPNIDQDSELPNGRGRPPLTSRTSSHYSKLPGLVIIPPQHATRRSSYSSATGIAPIAGGYVTNFSNSSSEPPSMPQADSTNVPLRVDTWVSHVDGALNSPTSVPESPIGGSAFADIPFGHIPQPERKRVDDFGFLNTIEASTRPYTPDMFAVEAGMLNLETTTTRNSSQRSKRSLASFGTLSKRSTTGTFVGNQNVTISAATGRNVLRKRSPSLKTAQMDGPGQNFSNASLPAENKSFLPGSLRGHPVDLDLSSDMPHTATTCAGPSRGLIKESSHASLADNDPPQKTSRKSLFNIVDVFSKGETQNDHTHSLDSGHGVGRGPKRSNTFSKQLGSSVHRQPRSDPDLATTYETVRNDGMIPAILTASASAPSSVSGSKQLASRFRSTVYGESRRVLRSIWYDGLTVAMEELKERRDFEKSVRYQNSATKMHATMNGALPEGSKRKSYHATKIASWAKFRKHEKVPSIHPDDTGIGGQHGFEGGFPGLYTGPPAGAIKRAGVNPVDESPTSPVKRSAFTEMFRLSRERTRESSKETGTTNKEGLPRHGSLFKKTKEYWSSVMH
jgi:hypothetical protein